MPIFQGIVLDEVVLNTKAEDRSKVAEITIYGGLSTSLDLLPEIRTR